MKDKIHTFTLITYPNCVHELVEGEEHDHTFERLWFCRGWMDELFPILEKRPDGTLFTLKVSASRFPGKRVLRFDRGFSCGEDPAWYRIKSGVASFTRVYGSPRDPDTLGVIMGAPTPDILGRLFPDGVAYASLTLAREAKS